MSVIKANGAGEVSTGFYNNVISRSLRFDATSSTRLESPTFSSDGGDTWTWSAWVKFHDLSKAKQVLFGRSGNNACFIYNDGGTGEGELDLNDDGAVVRRSTGFFRDVSNWYHVTLNGNGTVNRLWVNAVEVNFPSTANIGKLNEAVQHQIGDSANFSGDFHADISLADVNFVSGTALDYSAFAEFKNGVLIPIEPSVTYGGNGFRLQFLQTGSNADANGIGADTSGNNNHFTATNLNSHDVIVDCPENNFCTINDQFRDATANTIDEGGLKVTTSTSGRSFSPGTFLMTSGKWYFEFKVDENSGGMGVAKVNGSDGAGAYQSATSTSTSANTSDYYYGETNFIYYQHKIRHNGSIVTSLSGSEPSDLIYGVAVDMDASPPTITYYVDGSSVGSADLDTGFDYIPIAGDGSGGVSRVIHVNFGQNPTFSGEETAGTNTDGNGNGLFHDSVPSNHLALCASNLPDLTISPAQSTQADDHFNTKTYDGTGNTTQNITGVGFQPDWVWIKNRNTAVNHYILDSSRGLNYLSSSTNSAEAASTNRFNSFDSDGFQVEHSGGGNGFTNGASQTYVAWNWKANGGTTSSNGDGSKTSTVQANTTAGFSIVLYSGDTSSFTVGHGLNSAPEWVIVKSRTHSERWAVFHTSISDQYIYLNENFAGETTNADERFGNSTSVVVPNSTVVTLGANNSDVSKNGENYVMYCFHSVEGYSKFGSYTGNGDADGAFVYTGFRPAWVMSKGKTTTSNWYMNDTARSPFNPTNTPAGNLYADLPNVESGNGIDILSNGFKIRHGGDSNASSVVYIYMAFAEQPFKFSNAR